jgi:diguanylate cyclase (GGDEF)-like protein
MLTEPTARPEIYDENIFKLLLDYEVVRSQRYANPLSVLRIGLALINPTNVEATNAPIALASTLNARLRRADIPARVGNDFVVLLPNTNETSARIVCERLLRITVGTQRTSLGLATRVTICIGLASHGGGSNLNGERLMHEAESALKQARAVGPQTYRAYTDTALRRS